ncbi:CBS domain-containing protein [Streptomyces sp. NPDC002754]
MTLVQMQSRTASADSVHRKAAEVVDRAGPQARDDMSVEVALSVMSAARTGRLVVCDQDDQGIGVVTRAELAAVRDGFAYTDRVCLRDILDVHAPITPQVTKVVEAERATRRLRPAALPAVDEQNTASVAFVLTR